MQIIDAESIDALVASGRIDDAIGALVVLSQTSQSDAWPLLRLGRLYAELGQANPARIALIQALQRSPDHVEALWGLYELEQVAGDARQALAAQARAISLAPVIACRPLLHSPPGRRATPREKKLQLLMICVPGTFQANNPLEYIVDGDAVDLHKWFISGDMTPPLPDYDLIFNAIGYAHGVEPLLERASEFVASQDKPCINPPSAVLLTSRAAVTQRFSASRNTVAPPTVRMSRDSVKKLTIREPILLRPLNSQAGSDFAKISYDAELVAYLASVPGVEEFYHSPFVDYASRDGLFRKYRIAFIDGVPYPVHLAISPNWMVHYYNSAMAEHRWMRDEEAIFMRDINAVFTDYAAEGLREIGRSLPLEYFAVDCALTRKGEVLLFEADTAMIVHMNDPIEIYPYKHRYMPRIVDALERLFSRVSALPAR